MVVSSLLSLLSSSSSSRHFRAAAFLAWLLLLDRHHNVALGDIVVYESRLEPTEQNVLYANGYLRAPGASIDLNGITFTATDEEDEPPYDPDINDDDGGGGDDRRRRRLDGGFEVGATDVDIVAFRLPSRCASSRSGCEWHDLGVGKKTDDVEYWCCTNDAIDKGFCTTYGRLLLTDTFQGEKRSISVPQEGPMSKKLKKGMMEFDETGRYVVVFANCNVEGRTVKVSGNAVWKSKHGYLPGDVFGFMYFYTCLLVLYMILFVWYALCMLINASSRIPIEKWILMTIFLGLLELVFRTADYHDWNADGDRTSWLTYVGIITGAMKHGIARCLLVMVSLGWGVVRDSLGSTLRMIVFLGVAYVAVAGVGEILVEFAEEDIQAISYEKAVEIVDVLAILTLVIAAIDIIFIMWTLDALNGTMQYLENMSQSRKLQRYLRLRTLFLFAILFAAVWAVFALVDNYDEDGILQEEHQWAVKAGWETIFFVILVGVAVLWRPNPNAKEYAFAMELPTTGEDGETTELELTGVVPSAMDDDEDEEPSNGHSHDNRFKIDDAEAT